MQGPSRAALVTSRRELDEVLSSGVDASALAQELFAMTQVLDSSASLRRALGDPSRAANDKRGLADKLFAGKVSGGTDELLRVVVGQRWSEDGDLPTALDQLGVEALMASAESSGRIDQVEDELFRFERTVSGNPDLRNALSDRQRSGADKAGLVTGLLNGKAAPETTALAAQAAAHPRGQRVERALEGYLQIASKRREQLTATATVAIAMDEAHRQRLAQALTQIYGRPVHVNTVVDPSVVGGVHVQVGDEVIDGTILNRLEEARRRMAG